MLLLLVRRRGSGGGLMHRHRQAFLALAGALSLVPLGQLAAAEMPALPQLIEMLRPPGERASASASASGGFSTTAPTVSRARPAVDEAAARTTAPEGTAAAA